MTTTDEPTLRYIDSDGHILEHPTAMLEFAPGRVPRPDLAHRDRRRRQRVARVQRRAACPSTGLAGTAGLLRRRRRPGPQRRDQLHARPGRRGGRPTLRLQDMDTDGIELSVLYPTFMLGLQSVHDVEFGAVQARAYNEWCSTHLAEGQGRLFGAGALPPMHDPTTCRPSPTRSATWPSCPGWCRCSCGRTRRSTGATSTTRSTTRSGRRLQDTGLPIAFHPFLAPDLPGACEGLKLGAGTQRRRELRAARRVRRGRRRPAAAASSRTSTSPRPSPTPST